MEFLVALLLILGCRSVDSQAKKDSLAISGETGRNVSLVVKGVDQGQSKDKLNNICAIGLSGSESMSAEIAEKRLVCVSAKPDEKIVRLNLKDLPYPAYLTIFHDENGNGLLDFGSFDILVVKTEGPTEGIAAIDGNDENDKFSQPIWPEIGDNYLTATLRYGDLPFWKFVKEQAWKSFYGWYVAQTKPKNPVIIKK